MSEATVHPLESILRFCQTVAPEPWYPKLHAEQTGVDRASLDPPVDELRLGGWIQLTEWMQGKGQGYRLTDKGEELLADARAMAGVRAGKLPALDKPPEAQGASAWDRGEAAREAVFHDEGPPTVRNALIITNVIAFLFGLIMARQAGIAPEYMSGDRASWRILDDLGSLLGIRVAQGEWWRLITSCFLHGGWQHLVMNMFALFAIGGLAERMWGHVRFLILYLLSGLGGSCLMLAWQPMDQVVGASGAVCGIFAGQAIWLLINRRHLPPELAAHWMRNVVVMTVILVWMSMQPGVALLAHVGGAVTGAVLAVLIHFQRFGPRWQSLASLAGLLLVPILLVSLVLVAMRTTDDWARIHQRLRWISRLEARNFHCLASPLDLDSISSLTRPLPSGRGHGEDRPTIRTDAADLVSSRRLS